MARVFLEEMLAKCMAEILSWFFFGKKMQNLKTDYGKEILFLPSCTSIRQN